MCKDLGYGKMQGVPQNRGVCINVSRGGGFSFFTFQPWLFLYTNLMTHTFKIDINSWKSPLRVFVYIGGIDNKGFFMY